MIPNETINVYSKGQNKPEEVKKPLPSSVDLVEVNIKVRLASSRQSVLMVCFLLLLTN